jgi:CSLREA domain-containing protein
MSRPPLPLSLALIPFRVLVVATLLLATFSFPAPAEASTFVVNTRDGDDDGECNASHCSLREAINAANDHDGPDTIWFSFEDGSPPFMINPTSPLPALTDDGTTIDGTTMYEYEGSPSVLLLGGGDAESGLVVLSNGNTIRGLMMASFSADHDGAAIHISGQDNLVEGNVLISNDNGIYLAGSNNEVRANFIGLRGSGYAAPNFETGIFISGSGNLIEENTIAFNGGPGIQLEDRFAVNHNTFARNSFHDNEGLAIDIAHNNEDIDAPMISSVSAGEISGEACRGCTVEIYRADPDPTDYGEGVEYLAQGTADAARRFTVPLGRDLDTCDEITATATDLLGNTSEFSLNWSSPLCMTASVTFFGEPYLTVNTEDDMDDGTCDEAHCSLREAINEANSRAGSDTIRFDIPDATPHHIELERLLPQVTDDHTTIDGTTEPDYAGRPIVTLSGINGVSTGLRIESSRNTIRGLGFIYFGEAGYDYGWHDVTGAGIEIHGNLNLIDQNLLYLNGDGIRIFGNYNTLTGNQFGVIGSGLADWPNDGSGILISGDFNLIGGSGPGEGNQIAASGEHGINVYNSEGNRIQGNIIGGDASGEVAIPNSRSGIFTQGVTEIGGLNPGEGNIIIGNGENGIDLYDIARDSLIAGNVIHENEQYGILVDNMDPEEHTFTRNSIYNNGELGIENALPDDNLLRIDRASESEVSGFACRGCLVEVFLAEPDPTGFGEGKTFLGEARADVGGSWSVEISGVSRCDEITATATKSGVGTSGFAENALVSCLRLPGAPMVVLSALPFLVIVGIILVLQGTRPETPRRWLPGGAVLGLVLGGLLFGVLVFIPSIQLDFGPRAASPPEPLPGCGGFIDTKSLTPTDGTLFGIEEDPRLAWTVGGDLPGGEIQWRVEMRLPDQRLISLATPDESLKFSDFGLDPQPGGRYEWRLTGEVRIDESAEYLPFCSAESLQTFFFENPLLAQVGQVQQPVEGPTPVPPQEETTCTPSVMATMNATCRYGPDSAFHELGYLLQGESAPANAQTHGAGWFRVLLDGKTNCWIWSGAVEAVCTDGLTYEQGPEPPTEVPAPPTPADETAPPAPNTLTPKNGQEVGCVASVGLTWSSVTDPSGIAWYNVRAERSPDQSSWSPAPGSPWSTGSTGQSIPVECGYYYRWSVRAVDGVGNTGGFSAWSAFTVPLQ